MVQNSAVAGSEFRRSSASHADMEVVSVYRKKAQKMLAFIYD